MADEAALKNSGKTAGKVFFAFTLIVFIAVLCLSAYFGGQDKALTKMFSGFTTGDMNNYAAAKGLSDSITADNKADFKELCFEILSSYPEFSELTETDVVGYTFKVKNREYVSPSEWICTVDVNYFSDEMSVSETDNQFKLVFTSGKWIVEE